MSDSYKITQLAVYNPQRLDDDVFNALFVVRQKQFLSLIEQIKEEELNSIPQHHLIIGSRGYGKTTLLKRIEIELRTSSLSENYIPILYPEEQYNITSLDDLWLNSLDKLADILEQNDRDDLVEEIDKQIEKNASYRSIDKENTDSYIVFTQLTQKIKKRPVLLIDNINLIFNRLNKTSQHKLRNIITQNNAPIIIAASPIKIDHVLEYNAPFYDAFQINYLEKLNETELLTILNNLASLTNSNEIIPEIRKNISRIRVINQLTGGNPRTTVMLFKLISKGFSNTLIEDLDALLDDITPLYKARFEEELPPQLQSIVNAIALNWDPVNIERLRELTGLTNNKLSPQLKRLTESGWLIKAKGFSKGSTYELNERFFNIWYLMRQSSRRHKRQIIFLSKFLDSLYGDTIVKKAHEILEFDSSKPDHIIFNLAIAECLNEKDLKKKFINKCDLDLRNIKDQSDRNKNQIEDLISTYKINSKKETQIRNKDINLPELTNLLLIASSYISKSEYTKAESSLLKAIKLDPINFEANNNLGELYHYKINDYQKAIKYYKIALEIKTDEYLLVNMGVLYLNHLPSTKKAKEYFIKALSIDNENETTWLNLGIFHFNNNAFYKAKVCFSKATKLDNNNADALNALAVVINILTNSYSESETHLKRAIELQKNHVHANYNLGRLYMMQNKKIKESEQLFHYAIKVDSNYLDAYISLAELYTYHINKPIEAEKTYLQLLENNPENPIIWNGLGNLYQDYLKNYVKSKNAYLKALDIDKTLIHPKFNLTFLLRDKLKEINEAKKVFNSINDFTAVADSYYLNKGLFDLYDNNLGLAENNLFLALSSINDILPNNTQDDWWRFASVVFKLGHAKWLLNLLSRNNYDKILAPYYYAIAALEEKDPDKFLGTKAVEIRNAAKIVLEKIKALM